MALIRSISGGWAISSHQILVVKQQAASSNDLSHLSPPCLGRWRQERALADYDGFERGMAEALIKKIIISISISGSLAVLLHQVRVIGKLPSTLQVSVRQPGDGTWQEACGLLLRKAWQTSMLS